MPEELFLVIKNHIIPSRIVKRDSIWIYDFTIIDTGVIDVRSTLKTTMFNLGHDTFTKELETKTFSHIHPMDMTRMQCEIDGRTISRFDINDPSSNLNIRKECGDNGCVTYYCSIEIPPNRSVDLTTIVTSRCVDLIQNVHFIQYPTINAKLIVTFPEGYEFHLFPSFSNDLKRTISDNTRHVYEMKGGALPNQGFYYELKRIEKKGVASK